MTDQPPAAPAAKSPRAKASPPPGRAQRRLRGVIAVFGPYAALLVIWAAISFLKMSPEGLAEGRSLLLLFAGLVEPGKRALSNNDEDHPSA